MKRQTNTLENKIKILERCLITNEIVIDGVAKNTIGKLLLLSMIIKIMDPMINDCYRIRRIQKNRT